MTRARPPLTKDLFAWEAPKVAVGFAPEVTGQGPMDNRIARLISQALREGRDAGLSRQKVAARMSEFLGRTVSESMLNKWSSEGSEDHRIPFDAFIALVEATGVLDLLGFMPAQFGMTVIDNQYAEMIEDQLLDEHIREMEALRHARSARRKTRR